MIELSLARFCQFWVRFGLGLGRDDDSMLIHFNLWVGAHWTNEKTSNTDCLLHTTLVCLLVGPPMTIERTPV